MKVYDKLFLDGEWVEPAGGGTLDVEDPSTGGLAGRVPLGTQSDMDRAVAAARQAFDNGPWPRMRPSERSEMSGRLCDCLQARVSEIAETITSEVGTPISLSTMVQANAPIMFFRYYAELAGTFSFDEVRAGMMGSTLVVREPVGVVGLIVPWNYPLYLTISKLAPALAAGCTVIVKPSSDAPLNAFILAEAVAEAGLPNGVFNLVPTSRDVGEHLVQHPLVDKISFTGSSDVGSRIMGLCAEQIKRVTLELGGKSACIITEDASLDAALPMAANAALINSGQTCVAQTRLVVPRSRHDEIMDRLCSIVSAMKVGDPHDPTTNLGPLVSARQRDRVEEYVALGQEEGATLVLGGGRPEGLDGGYYLQPTIFDGVDNKMRIAQEEIFGPVLSVITYDTVDEAVSIANDSVYGLSGAVWCGDPAAGVDIARRIRTGTFHVNGLGMDPGSPFGGYKRSGLGRELGVEGLSSYFEVKSISLPAGYQPASA
ncbi:MAG TPA: aldehyde dehydrogenase [Acidimicrobiales bacterium]|nr:aldehyde dehydrogenase [Acidimicrobiales bacterium]